MSIGRPFITSNDYRSLLDYELVNINDWTYAHEVNDLIHQFGPKSVRIFYQKLKPSHLLVLVTQQSGGGGSYI